MDAETLHAIVAAAHLAAGKQPAHAVYLADRDAPALARALAEPRVHPADEMPDAPRCACGAEPLFGLEVCEQCWRSAS